MDQHALSRRALLKSGGMALTSLALLNNVRLAQAKPLQQGEEVIPWLDQLPENPVPEVIDQQLDWEALDSWITPNDQFFGVAHFGWPELNADE